MVQQGTLSLEHEVGWGVLGSAGYVMNLDRQLPNSVDINIAPSTDEQMFQLQGGTGAVGVRDGETFAVPVYTARVTTSFGPVTDMVSNANATYNGLTLEARRGLGRARRAMAGRGGGWSSARRGRGRRRSTMGRTRARCRGRMGSSIRSTVRYDKGLSALNFPHRVVATAVWSPRVRRRGGGAWRRRRSGRLAAGGWVVAGGDLFRGERARVQL